ncbi:FAD-dependent oxidoreductase [Patescibacteria group bacterium]|nr:FAD-dependent oxidoreductase [Patescibacteria group bacterium]
MNEKRRIVVLGGGFGGFMTVRHLVKLRFDGEIILIDKRDEHVFTPWLYEVASGFLFSKEKTNLKDLKKTSGISFTNLIQAQDGARVRFKKQEVIGCDFDSKHLIFIDGKTLQFDELVLAVGSEVQFFNIPGVKENSRTLKTLQEAMEIQTEISKLLEELRLHKRDRIKIVIGGAGSTGVELASELANCLNEASKNGQVDRTKIRILLIEAGDTVLQQMHPSLQLCVKKRLEKLGVELKLKTRLERLSKNRAHLVTVTTENTATEIDFDIFIWAGGIRPTALIESFDLPKDQRGRIEVEATFQVKGRTDIFALGDAAGLTSPYTKKSLPSLAQVAIRESRLVAQNIIRQQQGKPLKIMKIPKQWIIITPAGGKYSFMRIFGINICGRSASWVRKIIDLQYFGTILPWPVFWRLWRSAEKVFSLND